MGNVSDVLWTSCGVVFSGVKACGGCGGVVAASVLCTGAGCPSPWWPSASISPGLGLSQPTGLGRYGHQSNQDGCLVCILFKITSPVHVVYAISHQEGIKSTMAGKLTAMEKVNIRI